MPHLKLPGKKWNFKCRVGEMKENTYGERALQHITNKDRQCTYSAHFSFKEEFREILP